MTIRERPGDPTALGRVVANRPVLARLADGATRASSGVGPWSPDGWVMRTHPDLSEAVGRVAPTDLRMVYGVATLVDSSDRLYAIAWGTGALWLRAPTEAQSADRSPDAAPIDPGGLRGWRAVDAWRVDLARSIRASAELAGDLADDVGRDLPSSDA